MYDAIGFLVSETETVDSVGDTITSPTFRQVFVDEKSIRQSEFYQAQAVGLRPELMFEMRRAEYNKEPRFKYDDVTYDIIRTYKKNRDYIEIICQGIVNEVE
jgi:SPP1 family predicted phage head-tail adaptor